MQTPPIWKELPLAGHRIHKHIKCFGCIYTNDPHMGFSTISGSTVGHIEMQANAKRTSDFQVGSESLSNTILNWIYAE